MGQNAQAIAEWEAAISQHVSSVRNAQIRLESVLSNQRAGLVEGNAKVLDEAAREAGEIAGQLLDLESDRKSLLMHAQRAGVRATTLTDLVASIGLSEDTIESVRSTRGQAARIEHAIFTLRLVAAEGTRHYSELNRIIMTGDARRDTYDDPLGESDSKQNTWLSAVA